MRIKLGNHFFDAKAGKESPVAWDTDQLINAHLLMLGASGVGKTHTLRNLTARLIDRDGFRTRLGQLPAPRFNREHLLRRSPRACTSPVHAIVPAVTAGELTESLR